MFTSERKQSLCKELKYLQSSISQKVSHNSRCLTHQFVMQYVNKKLLKSKAINTFWPIHMRMLRSHNRTRSAKQKTSWEH
jgi:hypothetical protein